MEYLGAWGTLIHEKNLKLKISCQTPLKSSNSLYKIILVKRWLLDLFETEFFWDCFEFFTLHLPLLSSVGRCHKIRGFAVS
jgi:hypothetical protein